MEKEKKKREKEKNKREKDLLEVIDELTYYIKKNKNDKQRKEEKWEAVIESFWPMVEENNQRKEKEMNEIIEKMNKQEREIWEKSFVPGIKIVMYAHSRPGCDRAFYLRGLLLKRWDQNDCFSCVDLDGRYDDYKDFYSQGSEFYVTGVYRQHRDEQKAETQKWLEGRYKEMVPWRYDSNMLTNGFGSLYYPDRLPLSPFELLDTKLALVIICGEKQTIKFQFPIKYLISFEFLCEFFLKKKKNHSLLLKEMVKTVYEYSGDLPNVLFACLDESS